MKYNILAIIVVLLMITSCEVETKKLSKFDFYVGTYTDKDSKGIYKFELSSDGKMKNIGLMAETDNPSFLAKSIEGEYLIAVNEISDSNHHGRVESYQILEDTLILKNRKSSLGAHPCHVSINSDGYVVVSNYTSGSVALLRLSEHGELNQMGDHKHYGYGSDSLRQEGPHAHSTYFYPFDHQMISSDLGTNELWFYEIDFNNNKLKPIGTNLKMEEGAGPRHLCFHPNQKWFYVINEMHGSITQVELMEDGNYQKHTSVSTLRPDFEGENYSADIHISSDGRFLYASNRGPNEIAIFKVDEQNGSLSSLSHQPAHGNWPRNFGISPDEQFLLIANQYSNNITCFKIDPKDGLLTFISEIESPSPVCLLF